jgi:hypothetical protein
LLPRSSNAIGRPGPASEGEGKSHFSTSPWRAVDTIDVGAAHMASPAEESAEPTCSVACTQCGTVYTNAQASMTVSEAQANTTWRCGICLGTHVPAVAAKASAAAAVAEEAAAPSDAEQPARKKQKQGAAKKPGWRPEEDEELRQLVEKMGTKDWDNMAKVFSFDRPAGGLRNRWFGRLAHPTATRSIVEDGGLIDPFLLEGRAKRTSKKVEKFDPAKSAQFAKISPRTEEEERELQAAKERRREARAAREAQAAQEAAEKEATKKMMKDVDEFGFPRGRVKMPAGGGADESSEGESEDEEEEAPRRRGDWRARAMGFLSENAT